MQVMASFVVCTSVCLYDQLSRQQYGAVWWVEAFEGETCVPIKHTPWHETKPFWTLGYWLHRQLVSFISQHGQLFVLVLPLNFNKLIATYCDLPERAQTAVHSMQCVMQLKCFPCGVMNWSFWRGNMCADQTRTLTWNQTVLNAWLLTTWDPTFLAYYNLCSILLI